MKNGYRHLKPQTISIFKILLANRGLPPAKKVLYTQMGKLPNSVRGWLDRVSHAHPAGFEGPKLATKHAEHSPIPYSSEAKRGTVYYELTGVGAKYILDHTTNLSEFSKAELRQLWKMATLEAV